MATETDLWKINWKLVQGMGELTDEVSNLKLQIEREKLILALENEKLKNLSACIRSDPPTRSFWRRWFSW
jgi:hypothetical protein